MAKKIKIQADTSTEEKIKAAAKNVFLRKGFAATRTRDIAEEAGINLALLNYYFRSKEKLFEIVMMEKMQKMFGILIPAITNTNISLEEKIKMAVSNYIDMLIENPDLPIFVLSEIRNNPEKFAQNFHVGSIINNSSFIQQLKEKAPHVNPLHFLMSMLAMTVFPFVAKPVLQSIGTLNSDAFNALMEERKQLIPAWINEMLNKS